MAFKIGEAIAALGNLAPKVLKLDGRKLDTSLDGVYLSEQVVGNKRSWISRQAVREVKEHYLAIADLVDPRNKKGS